MLGLKYSRAISYFTYLKFPQKVFYFDQKNFSAIEFPFLFGRSWESSAWHTNNLASGWTALGGKGSREQSQKWGQRFYFVIQN